MPEAKTKKKVAVKSKKTAKKSGGSTAKSVTPAAGGGTDLAHPMTDLRDQIESMFDRYFHGWPGRLPRLGRLWDMEPAFDFEGFARSPSVDMSQTDKGYEISVELPGMDEKDLEVNVTDDVLTISGEKRDEREEKKKDFYLQERRYGQFRRTLRLPADAEVDKIRARVEKGVLRVDVPKTGEAKKRGRKIEVS